MTTTEINILLAVRKKSATSIASALTKEDPEHPVSRASVSQTFNYLRENLELRQRIADHLGMPVDELFDPMPPVPARPQEATASTY